MIIQHRHEKKRVKCTVDFWTETVRDGGEAPLVLGLIIASEKPSQPLYNLSCPTIPLVKVG